jgi:hypothetical protein
LKLKYPINPQDTHVTSIGPPHPLDPKQYGYWKALMRAHIYGANYDLWESIMDGYSPVDPLNLTPKKRGQGNLTFLLCL